MQVDLKASGKICWGLGSLYFCYIGPHAKFRNPRTTSQNTPFSTQKSHSTGVPIFPPEKEEIMKERENKTLIMATSLAPLAHTLFSDQQKM